METKRSQGVVLLHSQLSVFFLGGPPSAGRKMNPGLWREPRSSLWGLFMFPDCSKNKTFQVFCTFLFGACLAAMPKWLCLQGMPELAALLHFWFLTLSIVPMLSQLHFLEILPWLLREAVLLNSTKRIHEIWQNASQIFSFVLLGITHFQIVGNNKCLNKLYSFFRLSDTVETQMLLCLSFLP